MVYDAADHQISGVSQQQGGGQDLAFSLQHGPIELSTLRKLGDVILTTGIDALHLDQTV
jgi:hypothetical protein